jgi:hypothetical protein
MDLISSNTTGCYEFKLAELTDPHGACLLLIPQSFDRLAAFHLDMSQAILFIAV